MSPNRRRLRAAALIVYGLAAAGTAALAQENSNTIGPPQLKDFTLPGQRTTPPASPPPSTTPPPPAATPAPETPPAARSDRPALRTATPPPRREVAPARAAPAPAPETTATVPAGTAPLEAAPVETAPAVPAPGAQAPESAEPAPQGGAWLWPAAGAALLLLLGSFLLLRGRRDAQAKRARDRDTAREELGGALAAAPRPEPQPEPEPEAPPAPRPWLELDIVPERAAATGSEAVVHYALTVTNQGDAEARNLRIDPRLFNASAEADMIAFFRGPIHDESGSPHIVIAPGGSLKLNGQVAMPMTEVREIELAGRRIFVPMVAINVAYDWSGGGSGRTSRSWLVGREAETPSAKMGPFRLDLGPRIYRSVGRREGRLVRV